jgi:hypothetical protein
MLTWPLDHVHFRSPVCGLARRISATVEDYSPRSDRPLNSKVVTREALRRVLVFAPPRDRLYCIFHSHFGA